ncbi:hypothetical protein OVA24_17160 [Luteolibacter sp. SL250]|uniref:hypothetical protein n=1 Tax=Luteolibacter sp. SL250 TaxID=2995170 RepID=UPI0022701A2D|nr:hypothetical protein [Luteolibacter sp. SL250]WAC18963.1 hypothetical protein OVA24_17160 [Luteolibacter sp. SL250]
MKLLLLALVPAVLPLTGCSIINMAAGPGNYERHYAADTAKWSIDGSIQDELRKEPPGGYRTKPYSRSLWDRYWNSVLSGYLTEVPHPQYRGPSGDQFAAYIIRERQKAGLPAIRLTPENRKRLKAAGIPTGA